MNAYPTTSTQRRPIADIFRRTAHAAVRLCQRHGIHADAVSYASMVAGLAAALSFVGSASSPGLLLLGVLLSTLRLWLNMLDGMVALAAGQASPRGEILNDLPDRASDVMIFVGIAHSGLCHPLIAYWCAIFALLVAYVGTLARAVGAEREFSGPMSKPWRMATLSLGAIATYAALHFAGSGVLLSLSLDDCIARGLPGLTILDLTGIVILVGSIATLGKRLARTLRQLQS